MSEIEKLYKNAGIAYESLLDTRTKEEVVRRYPPFTAAKQIELIKEIYPGYPLQYASGNCGNLSFEEGLAYRINNSWGDLMSKQKQQIKEILE